MKMMDSAVCCLVGLCLMVSGRLSAQTWMNVKSDGGNFSSYEAARGLVFRWEQEGGKPYLKLRTVDGVDHAMEVTWGDDT